MIALLSVADKTNLVPFARGLHARGWRLRASGGTAAALRQAGLPVEDVAAVTGHPEILGGRVKTLHPAVHAGILTRRTPEDAAALAALGYAPIDLVAVNLYPFRQTVAAGAPEAEVLEQIDIGGPALLRAAAKSFPHVWAVCDPADYDAVLAALDAPAEAGHALRRRLAAKAFAHTAAYDAVIAAYLADEAPWPPLWVAAPARRAVLRYGENPDQRAAWYTDPGPGLRLRHEGAKGLSYNNLLDLDAAWLAASQWTPAEGVVCAVVKHGTPCGIGLGATATEALERAWACDPTSAYGGILAWNAPLDMPALHASSVLRTFARLVERGAARPPSLEEGEPVAEVIRRFGFHAVDVSTCADGRLGGLLDHVLRVPPAIVTARKSFAGAMFDVEEAIARFERVELGRWREGRPNPASEPTRYLKLGVYHFSSLDPGHEGCAAHGSDERRAASALLGRLEDFAEGVARRHGENARPAILLVGVDTDTDAIRVHVPDAAGRIDLDRSLSSAELHAATRDLPRAEAKEEIRRRVAAAIGVAPDDPATEGMRWFCGYLLKNNIAQVDAVLARFGGPYPDRGHGERLIVVGDPIDDVQLRNLAFQAQMRSIEEGEGDLAVGTRLLGERLGPAGLAVPVLVLQTFDATLPGAAERAAGRANLMLRALERRFPAAAGAARIVAEAAIRPADGGPLRFLPREPAPVGGRCCGTKERVG